ncbi:MAG: prepilin-type N-terminal cleavage/methylation domain-containing protein [bacterium]
MISAHQIKNTERLNVRRAQLAFTLVELLVVMGLMMMLMVAGLAGYRGMRRGAELRGADSIVRTTLMLARQQAVMKRKSVEVFFIHDITNNSLRIVSEAKMIHSEVFLPTAIEFIAPPASIKFGPAGSAGLLEFVPIKLQEKTGMGSAGHLGVSAITNWPLTGVTQ